MSVLAHLLVLASGVQGGTAHPVSASDTPLVLLLIVLLGAACVPIFLYLRRRHRRPPPVSDQWQALAVMGELCPDGWQAQITLYGWGAPLPPDAPPSRVPMVELEWKRFDEESGRVAVARRVWAPTIAEALQAMVEDRRTDITIEEIERSVAEGEDLWGND
jgi:hypothetical protein